MYCSHVYRNSCSPISFCLTLNTIALRMAKALWSFGCSECYWVNTLLHSDWSKLYRVLAFLSAIGLMHSERPVGLMHSKWPKHYGVLTVLSAIGLMCFILHLQLSCLP